MNELDFVTVPDTLVGGIVNEVHAFGLRRLETGGFLLAPRNAPTVSVLALAGDVGIVRRHNLFQISARALGRLFAFADERGLRVPVQFHSHGIGAFLSETDAAHGLCVEGFTSIVIPHFANPPLDMAEWGWWRFEGGRWIAATAARNGHGDFGVVRFDEEGVRGT